MTSGRASYSEIVKFKLRWILVAFALLIASLFSRSALADKAMPSPNAYDYYVKAAAAFPKNPPKSTFPKFDDGSPDKIASYHSALERNEAVLKANAQTLKLLRQGFAFQFETRSDPTDFPFYARMRQIARVLMLESQVRAAKGDWAGAANSVLDGIRLGQDISHGSIIATSVGRRIKEIVGTNLTSTLNHVDATTARDAAKRLEKILSQKVFYTDVLESEKQYGLSLYKQIAAAPDEQKGFSSKENMEESKGIFLKVMNGLIASARLPYPQRITSIPVPDDPINKVMLELYGAPKSLKYGMAQGLTLATQQTQTAFILVEFALRAYYLEHGNYPKTLNGLVPGYLQKVPDDPFTANQPLRYKSEKTKYTLYSIGPDGKDDDGKPIKEGFVPADSKGDIVAGVKNS